MAKETELNPSISPTDTAIPTVQQLWLEGMPPVLAKTRKSRCPVRKNFRTILTN
jgi:hypothetical protein